MLKNGIPESVFQRISGSHTSHLIGSEEIISMMPIVARMLIAGDCVFGTAQMRKVEATDVVQVTIKFSVPA